MAMEADNAQIQNKAYYFIWTQVVRTSKLSHGYGNAFLQEIVWQVGKIVAIDQSKGPFHECIILLETSASAYAA
ncbi:hypothetical protein BpHYR1_024702 [Brachionus plicatilis]|uniref:Uncharacterized protein n=1 Tax=Brachionus plicatilis TaxID=10195 RepID=A0A3M7SBD0_BRAPC|nr:hypothetical protein BpHYR1_024702 [Brachionus plicatilis]